MAQLYHSLGAGQITQRVGAQIGQPRVERERVEHHRFGRAGQQGLAAMAEIAQSRGAVDGRAGVVALVAQLNLSGMQPNPQPDRGQRLALQPECTSHRIRRAGKRRDEAVALALFDGSHAVVGGDGVRYDLIHPRHGRDHLVGLAFPEPRGALHVSQQQRHRARRQKPAHAKIAPVHQRRIRARIDVAHANQHAAPTCDKTSAQTRRLQPVARVSTTPERADLSRPKHNQSQAITHQHPGANSRRQPGATST